MKNYKFQNATKIIFGRGMEKCVGEEILPYGKKVLFHHYGDEFILNSKIYRTVQESMKNVNLEIFELTGVQPNPVLSKVKEGIEICKKEKIDFILALGGGSVIDSAKAIGLGATYDGDVWDHYTKKHVIQTSLPVGVVLTIPATGSESSAGSVITNEKNHIKLLGSNGHSRPVFAIMNPEITYTVPYFSMAVGGVDMMSHVMERYFTNETCVELTDRLCEATLRTIIHNLPRTLKNPMDYAARSEIVFAGNLAHNGLLDCGRVPDWACHFISHILGGFTNLSHGATLSILTPHWMDYVYRSNIEKFAQFAVRVWNEEYNPSDKEETALAGIRCLRNFWKELGVPMTLSEAGVELSEGQMKEIATIVTEDGPVGNLQKLYKEDVFKILKASA